MYFKQLLDERCGCASYLVASRQSLEAAIIDPGLEIGPYLDLLAERGFSLRYVIDTHVHADHVSGARRLSAATGAQLCLHESAHVTYPYRGLVDGEQVALGQLRLRVLHTPGHRPELISLLIVNPPRSPEPSMVLTADCLLVGDVGRPDFGGGDASQQYDSITRLLRLPDWVAVFPGHFEGPCGKGMCGRPSTTIGFERLYNPLTRVDRAPFITLLTEDVPARPLNMLAIEATNRGVADMAWAMLTSSPRVPEVGVTDVAQRSADTVLVDVREPSEYALGHVPGAVSIPQAELASRLAEVPRDRLVVTVCAVGQRSRRAAEFLSQAGYVRVATMAGGVRAWSAAGQPSERASMASPPGPRVAESEWTHAGVISHGI